jgi:hypothetical protein
METILSIKQRTVAHREFGIKFSKEITEKKAAQKLSNQPGQSKEVIWSNKIPR